MASYLPKVNKNNTTILLSSEHEQKLRQWLKKPASDFKLLFKATANTYNAQEFHRLCDNQGPTIVVAYSNGGDVFGGYASVSWRSAGRHVTAPGSFLFNLKSKVRFPLKLQGDASALYDDGAHGPTFGGYDWVSFTGTGMKSSLLGPSYSRVEAQGARCNIGNTYSPHATDRAVSYEEFGGLEAYGYLTGTFCADLDYKDIEVYTIRDKPVFIGGRRAESSPNVPKLKETAWRTMEWTVSARDELVREVSEYRPLDSTKAPQAQILLLGPSGGGKSSYFNTINSIFRGHVTSQAVTGIAPHSLTTKFRRYEVRSGRGGDALGFRLCDTMGLEDGQGLGVADIPYLLGGNVPDRYQFNPAVSIDPSIPGFKVTPPLSDTVHCVTFVIDACVMSVLSQGIVDKIKGLRTKINERGIPTVVLLTKVDEICPEVAKDLSVVYSSALVQEKVKELSGRLGVSVSNILPVKNYASEMELDRRVDILALTALRQMLRFADNYFDDFGEDQEEEHDGSDDVEPTDIIHVARN